MQKAAFDSFFRHQIGDVVIDRAYVEAVKLEAKINDKKRRWGVGAPTGMVIVERLLQQCHGGIQGHYVVRRWSKEGSTEILVRFVECEVLPYADVEAALLEYARPEVEAGAEP